MNIVIIPKKFHYRASTKCQHRKPVRDPHWQTSAEDRYHSRHMPVQAPVLSASTAPVVNFLFTEKNLVEMLLYLWCSCATTLEGNCSALHGLAGLLFCRLTALPQLRQSCCPTGGNAAASHINLYLTILFNGQFNCFDISEIVVNYYIF